jgi:uncharacterized membrane protein YfcA
MMNLDLFELAIVVAVFVLAGMVKGVIGLGLPTVAMGLLGALMTPNHAAAILVVPALLTNVWQMWDGPALKILLRRLWPMLVCARADAWGRCTDDPATLLLAIFHRMRQGSS